MATTYRRPLLGLLAALLFLIGLPVGLVLARADTPTASTTARFVIAAEEGTAAAVNGET
jgi:hypothetical protein